MALPVSSLDITIVATALHSIEHGLHPSINRTSWVIAYLVGTAIHAVTHREAEQPFRAATVLHLGFVEL